ncbi:hypothetical protein LTR85_003874 [Meristemomyces frigidus]|nr:hypothetical protein LTR85_003874 [Meristemomyces frigidus]
MPNTFDPTKDIGDLNGKTILVTGGNAGIGEATVRALAMHKPACLYLCARNTTTAHTVVESIRETNPEAKIEILQLDLSSFDSIKECAAEFNAKSDRLDILVLNAGVGVTAPKLTNEGYESQFGINHLGHSLLTQLILPKMLETHRREPGADVRITVTSSMGANRFAPSSGLALGDMHDANAFKSSMTRYGHSKLANILFARKLAQLYPSITTTSTHPGLVKSAIWGRMDGPAWQSWLFAPLVYLTGVTTAEGAKTQLWAATANGVETGKYYEPIGKATYGSENANSQELTDELWEWTRKEVAKHGGPGWPPA